MFSNSPIILISLKEACQELNCKKETLHELIIKGSLPFIIIDGRLLFDLKEIRGWINEGRKNAA